MTAESFSEEERQRLSPYFTNLDGHVFALTNLPETVKGALFARYSRSSKSLRRLFLDEFHKDVAAAAGARGDVGTARAEQLYARVFNEYGDDSVAQLGGAHIACEYVSNILTKVLERGRLMAYLEQSTRYVPYTDKLHGRWRYHVPAEIGHGALREQLRPNDGRGVRDLRALIPIDAGALRAAPSQERGDSDAVHRAAIRAKALDTLRGMLPAATQSNVGIYGIRTGVRSPAAAHAGAPARGGACLRRCDADRAAQGDPRVPRTGGRPERGGRWTGYLAEIREGAGRACRSARRHRTGVRARKSR